MAIIKGDIIQYCNQRYDCNRYWIGDNFYLCIDRICRYRMFWMDVVFNGDVVDDRQNGVNYMICIVKNGQCIGYKWCDN